MPDWFRSHAGDFPGELKFSENLASYTYYRIGGPADVFATPRGVEGLRWLSRAIAETGTPFFVLGAGSNLLVSDQGFRGCVIRAAKVDMELAEMPAADAATVRIRAGAGVMVSTLLRRASQSGWGGLEFLSGVPGSVGGAVVMNAGTHLGETQDRLRAVEFFRLKAGKLERFEGDALKYSYRKNHFLPEDALVVSAEWEAHRQEPAQVKALIDQTLLRRKNSQPIEMPSCGSVFKNPKSSGLHAWQVMDRLGLRGHQIGGAQFSEKHCNFIVNLGNAKASDVRELITLAKSRAQSELAIELEEEVKYLGF